MSSEEDMFYQPRFDFILYNPEVKAFHLDIVDYINNPSKYQDVIGGTCYIEWKDLSYDIAYNFNVGFTDLKGDYTTGYCQRPYRILES